jgi:hypothetical protein
LKQYFQSLDFEELQPWMLPAIASLDLPILGRRQLKVHRARVAKAGLQKRNFL